MRAVGRQLLTTAGNQVLRVAVDHAIGKVDQVAGRLDAVAASGGADVRATLTNKPAGPVDRGASGPQAGGGLKVKVGAAFSFVMHRAMLLVQLIKRLAQQLLRAIARLVRRHDGRERDEAGDGGEVGGAETTGRDDPAHDATGGRPVQQEERRSTRPRADERTATRARPADPPRRPGLERSATESVPQRRRIAGGRVSRSGGNG
jgi:hypothetical protein